MPQPPMLTTADVIESCNEFMTGRASASQSMLRRAIQAAYREVAGDHQWSFLLRNGRVQLVAAEKDATCEYDHTGGTYERMLTISGATWDEDTAADMVVKIGDAVHQVESYKESDIVTLDATLNPGVNVDEGTECMIYREWYALPHNFLNFEGPAGEDAWRFGRYVSPQEMMAEHRYRDTTGSMRLYTVAEVPDLMGTLGLFIAPPGDSVETCDFAYKRRSRVLRFWGQADQGSFAGTVTATRGSKTVAGTSTSFADSHIGSVLRISSGSSLPTGLEGANPHVEERSILAVASTTSLTLDADVETTGLTDVKYVIADPIDLGQPAWDAFLRSCEKHLAITCNLEDQQVIAGRAREALLKAKGRDSPVRQRRVVGSAMVHRARLADVPPTRDMDTY